MMTLKTPMRSMKKTLVLIAAAAGLTLAAGPALAEGGGHHLRDGGFSFDGPFGTFDQGQLQRGYKVYREVCASCHSMDLMHFRTLAEPGGPFYDAHQASPAENRFVKALAKEVQIADIDTETGEPVMRDGTAADRFPHPYPNATAAAAANGGACPAGPVGHGQGPSRRRRTTSTRCCPATTPCPGGSHASASGQHYNAVHGRRPDPVLDGRRDDKVPYGGFIAMARAAARRPGDL
jgi:ubiquinol-cytochrome c reductase cytochrome c1 subunit